jgi:uncharacterized phage protein (TIGR01671 family)
MNREIKFRAWDKKENEFIYSGIEFEWRLLGEPGRYGKYNEGGSDSIGFLNIPDRFIIEQYTGLKDKNGKEIYEGDYLDDNEFGRLRVEWFNGWWGVYHVDENGHMSGDDLECYCEDREICGNIHETPNYQDKK